MLHRKNYTADEIIPLLPKIFILKAKADCGICQVVQLEFSSVDLGKQTFIIDPLLNGVCDQDEINCQCEKMNFSVYASVETILEVNADATYYIDSQDQNYRNNYIIDKFIAAIQRNDIEDIINDCNTVNNKTMSSLQCTYPNNYIRNNLIALQPQALSVIMPIAEELAPRLFEDIIKIATDCMSFTYSVTAYSSTRALVDIAKMEAIELTKEHILMIDSSPHDYSVPPAYNKIIQAYRDFGIVDGNVEINNLAFFMTNLIYNHLTSRHGNCGGMSRINAIYRRFILKKDSALWVITKIYFSH